VEAASASPEQAVRWTLSALVIRVGYKEERLKQALEHDRLQVEK
jgi:hypothetical protein